MGGTKRENGGAVGRAPARICLFGSIRVDLGGRTLGPRDFGSRKAKQLLEIMALARCVPVPKDRLIELLWGGHLPRQPATALEHNVSVLRSALGGGDRPSPILTVTGGYQLDPSRVEIDLDEFDGLAEGAAQRPPGEAIERLERALELAAGEVLEDEP